MVKKERFPKIDWLLIHTGFLWDSGITPVERVSIFLFVPFVVLYSQESPIYFLTKMYAYSLPILFYILFVS